MSSFDPPARTVVLPEKMADALRDLMTTERDGSFTIHLARGTPKTWEARITGRVDTPERQA